MITTVTLNPMLDKTIHLHALQRGRIQRASKMEMVAGGKGINVSRQLHRLKVPTLATGFLGGEVGKIISNLIEQEGYDQDFVWTGVTTREGLTFLEEDGTSTAVFEPSLTVSVEEVHELSKKVASLAERSSWIVCSGSSLGGAADDLFYEAISNAQKAGVRSVLDSYGSAFTLALKALPTLVKPNRIEFEGSLQIELANEHDVLRALDTVLSTGVQYCVLTDGSRPAYAASSEGHWKITPAEVRPVNPVGSGDAMVAGLLYGFEQSWDFERCLKLGAAAGAANAQVREVANSPCEEITKLESKVRVRKLA